jgi:hypothetical protein
MVCERDARATVTTKLGRCRYHCTDVVVGHATQALAHYKAPLVPVNAAVAIVASR